MMKMQMQRWLVCFAALLAGQSALAQQNLAQQNPSHEFLKSGDYHVTQSWSQENSFERPYHVRVPDAEDKPRQLPVLIFLHGNGGNAQDAMRGFIRGRGTIASRYVLVFPQGYRESWNIVSERSKADDLGFIEAIVLKLATYENVDPENFTIMGASNGAAMVNQLAIESKLPNIRNYISGVSQLNIWQHDGEHFRAKGDDNNYRTVASPAEGKRLLNISGVNDKLVPYHGGPSKVIPAKDGKLAFVDAEESTFLWARQMGYEGVQLSRPTRTIENAEVFRYLDGDVVHYKVLGEGHGATYGISEKLLLDFLDGNQESHAKQEVKVQKPHTGQFIEFTHNDVKREYLLHVPQDLPVNSPLVFVLHGYRGDARDLVELGMDDLADTNGFAVCYPQGADDLEGIPHWNARLKISKMDDIGFLSALASDLQNKHSLNKGRTFVCGVSNGGFMSYALVAEKPDVFKAAASVIGTMSGHTWEHRDDIPPVPILQISGLDDEIVPYNGSMSNDGGWGGAPDQGAMLEFWRKLNKTNTEEVIQLSNQTTAHHYKDGINGNEVWHYQIKNFGHRVPGKRELGTSAADVIWQFFGKVSDGAEPQRDIAYDTKHERNVLDFWPAQKSDATSDEPAPVLIWFHPGGFRDGDKSQLQKNRSDMLQTYRNAGYAVVSCNYPFLSDDMDHLEIAKHCARAVQFVRSKAKDWNLDPARLCCCGVSAGALISEFLAYHDDFADPSAKDSVSRQSSRPAVVASIMQPRGTREFALRFMDKGEAPIFIYSDAKPSDRIHPPWAAIMLRDKAQELGIPCLAYGGGRNKLPTVEKGKTWLQLQLKFCQKHLEK
jgi:poly(3-hydroxybutyrate) depolymerase